MGAVGLGMPGIRTSGGARGPPPPGRLAPPARPDRPDLVDGFGRVATDLRVSLTDRCNLRCSYCMPPEGLDWLPGPAVLSDDEVVRLIRVAVLELGITDVRFTGGEPLLRRGLEQVVTATSSLCTWAGSEPRIALTTNGIGLARRAAGLRAAGLDRVNISLDTVQAARFRQITHRDRLDDVLAGISAAAAAGLGPVKINAVLLPGVNDDEAVPLVRWAMAGGYELRFIEQMPLDPGDAWDRSRMITAEQILADLAEAFELTPDNPAHRGAAPAQTWTVRERGERASSGSATVGVIASVTRPFCGDCDRTRLTADGQLRTCLFAGQETDLRGPLRSGAADAELADLWRRAMWGKRAGHGIDDPSFLRPDRPMSAIGG